MTPRYAGRWRLERSIVDGEAGRELICLGTASLDDTGGTLLYTESVSYELAGKSIRATRVYRFRSTGPTIVATFDDGTPFFSLHLGADGTGTAVHPCGTDRYTLSLNLADPAAWETCWDVTGSKRLQIVTRYVRA